MNIHALPATAGALQTVVDPLYQNALVTAIEGALVVSILFFWITAYNSRAILRANGSGNGSVSTVPGSPGYGYNHLNIENPPGFIGINIGTTVLFGHRIHGGMIKGVPVDRRTAQGCTAELYDIANVHVAGLWWRVTEDGKPHRYVRTLDIASGEIRELMCFAWQVDDPSYCYAYQPGIIDGPPRIPPEAGRFGDTREFVVRIMYSRGRQRTTIPVTMRKSYDGNWSLAYNQGRRKR
jgi:hypothetical protein